ncbi:transitional endoplasmic reticulum ATPase [Halomicrobium zhouii]|uniref:Transitional endoplasmic reticulum ATPase n=1 Tax=Halomicrobium zhouii TaxID=767519 RepID=A0A1I6LV39_9EURY|nr:AAA family ATPase [Halomicrobium zhouii]SFS07240.1 transitional endoplasmic reticulum ATPase [Halomicrobium zhouii]
MSGQNAAGLELSVEGANKRDAGRGIARLPESARSRLGVLSGDPVIVEGDRRTVVKVWPADEDGQFVRVDADTRANAGVNIGDVVTVHNATVDDATSVTVQPAQPLPGNEAYEHTVRDRLVDRMVQADERVHVEGLGTFLVRTTTPDGSVRVADDTRLTVLPYGGDESASRTAEPSEPTGESPSPEDADIDVSYEDIGGLDEELDLIREMIEVPLSEPERFRRLGIDPPSGVLLHGPPGTGKTLIARAVANEVDAYFDTISGPEIVSKYKGESEERLREAFEQAEANAPAILFIDEIDSIAGARDEDADMENRVVAQLLTLMDGLEDRGRVVVIGATNRVDTIDEALRRGGRFDREIEIGVPDEGGRREILDVHTREMPMTDDVDLDRVAGRTHGFVGADLQSLTTEAAMNALRREKEDPDVSREDFGAALAAVDPSAMREYVAESPTVTFDDVGGLEEAKDTLTEAVQWPLVYGPLFDAANTDPPTGVLLYGPPGTGKTLLARAVAGESGVNFVHVNGPELLDRYVGESEKAVREVFDRARQTAPSIVFLDEIDAIAGQRGETHEVTERVVSQLLTELDGVTDNPNLVVLAATNRREGLDDALLRPGRLEQHVEVPNPDEAARRKILEVHTEGKPLGDDVDLDRLAAVTEGRSGADLEALVRAASMRAIREVADSASPDEANERADDVVIEGSHFDDAMDGLDWSG